MKVAIFWIGTPNKAFQKSVKHIEGLGYEVITPSNDEIKDICIRYTYAKASLAKGKISFISDIWRMEKAIEVNGRLLYLDGTVEVKDFNKIIDLIKEKKCAFFKEDRYAYASSIFLIDTSIDEFSRVANEYIGYYKSINKYPYKKVVKRLSRYKIAPNILTRSIINNYFINKKWEVNPEKGIFDIREVLDFKNGVNKVGKASWTKHKLYKLPTGEKVDWFGMCKWQWNNKKFLSTFTSIEQWVKYYIIKY